MAPLRIACWQADAAGDSADLLDRIAVAARAARGAGARLLITPELSARGYACAAEPAGDQLRHRLSAVAADAGIAVVFGWPETTATAVHNAASLVAGDGEWLATYHKTHLYGDAERARFVPGDVPLVQARVAGLTVGLLICYDIEFPELVRMHALAGTELLAVPTALMEPWDFVARTIVPARAFESQLYIAYTNWSGHGHRIGYCGLSRIADPHGRVHTAGPDGEDLIVADIDPAALVRARAVTPYLRDRRPEIYQG